jgi:hypothetical protein
LSERSGKPGDVEAWARKVQTETRRLMLLYAEAYAGAYGVKKSFFQTVAFSGIHGTRRLWTITAVLQEAVARHIEVHLKHLTPLKLRAYLVERPRSPKTEEERASSARVAASLNQAAGDVKALAEIVGEPSELTTKLIRGGIGLIRRLLPLGFAARIVSQFSTLKGMSDWQVGVFCFLIFLGYHFFALVTLPFHDSYYRKHLYFDGYMNKGSDGLNALFPGVIRVEEDLFNLLGTRPPLFISWDDVIPAVHTLGAIALVVALLLALPFDRQALWLALVIGFSLVTGYVWRLRV